jgi:hypothetical protein
MPRNFVFCFCASLLPKTRFGLILYFSVTWTGEFPVTQGRTSMGRIRTDAEMKKALWETTGTRANRWTVSQCRRRGEVEIRIYHQSFFL